MSNLDDKDNYYYQVRHSSNTGSGWHTAHTFDDLIELLRHWEELGSDAELTIIRRFGWDEKEREELARLKAKYEPEASDD